MRTLLILVVGIALGAGGLWYYSSSTGRARVDSAAGQVGKATRSAAEAVQEKLRVLDLRTNDFKEELNRTGRVIRRKAQEAGQAIADATADARITGAIKAKLLGNRDLSAVSISVNTTAGVVTLSGTVASNEDISKAMLLALETEGVSEVIATLQVRAKPGPN